MCPMNREKRIKILIVDDHSVVRKGLKLFLATNDRLEVCAEAGTLKEAVGMVAQWKPDVVLLDYKLPDGDGIIGCINIKTQSPTTKVIILTAYTDEGVVVEAIRAGVDAYLLKDVESDKLIETILAVYEGENVIATSATEDVFNHLRIDTKKARGDHNFSNQETKILQMIALGKINKEIALEMGVSENTVRNYISRVFKKINVSNRTEAASYWLRNKL